MANAPLVGDRENLLDHAGHGAYRNGVEFSGHGVGHDQGAGKRPRGQRGRRSGEGAVFEFADDVGADAALFQPAVDLAAHHVVPAGQEHRGAGQSARETGSVALGQGAGRENPSSSSPMGWLKTCRLPPTRRRPVGQDDVEAVQGEVAQQFWNSPSLADQAQAGGGL